MKFFLTVFLASMGAACCVSAQSASAAPNLVVAYGLATNKNVLPLADGGFITFQPTAAKTTAEADIVISNQGNAPGSVIAVSLTGTNFQLANLPLLPATLAGGQILQFAVLFSPQQLGASTGKLRIDLQDRSLNVTVQGTTAAPGFALSYTDPISKNNLAVPEAGAITLNNIPVNTTVVSTITLQNQGSGTGFVNGVTVTGGVFQLTGAPVFPATVSTGATLQFGVQFAPTQPLTYNGTVRIDYPDRTVTYTIVGSATGPTFSYALVTTQLTTPILSGGILSFSTPVGQTTTQTLLVTNTGNGDGQITSASISGAGFQITDVPPLPFTLKIGASQTFTITFTPTQAGTVNGRLQIAADSFQLAGTALGSKLTYTYTNSAGSTIVAESGLVILSPAQVGSSSSVQFMIQNGGTSTATISTVSVSGAGFTIQNAPALPSNIDPGNSMMFTIAFAPNNTGDQTGSLRVNNATFSLVGNGQQPLAVPAYQIGGPSGTQAPLQQPSVSLHLASPYPLPLVGTLSLSFVSDVFSSNPAIQFASGGTTAHFTIPANSMDAVFDNGTTSIAFQTGTVAGTVKVTPTFATQGGLDLTPASPPSLSVNIARSAPQILSAAMTNRALKSFTIVLTGFSTTRSLKTLTFTLSTSDSRFTGTTITTNVEPAATTWFQSTASGSLGGLFSASVPFTLSGGGSTEDLVQAIQAISVTATNDVGTSSTATVQLQ